MSGRRVLAWMLVAFGGILLTPILAFLLLMLAPGANLMVVAPSLVLLAGAATIAGVLAVMRGIVLLRRA